MAKSYSTSYDDREEAKRRLSQVGGCITIKPNGKPIFQFPSKAHYDEYLRLGAEANKRQVAHHAG